MSAPSTKLPQERIDSVRRALSDPYFLCSKLGLLNQKGSFLRQHGGVIVRCPVHDEKTPSCSVQRKNSMVMWRCHGCGAAGDVFSFVASALGLSTKTGFLAVFSECEALAGLDSSAASAYVAPIQPEMAPEPAREYPNTDELAAFLAHCGPVTEDSEVSGWLRSRGLDPVLVDQLHLGVALPARCPSDGQGWAVTELGGSVGYPNGPSSAEPRKAQPDASKWHFPKWAQFRGFAWSATGHRLILPMFDHTGRIASVRASRVNEREGPKRLPPAGCRASGILLANQNASAMLAGRVEPESIIIVEGEPDWLTWSTRTHESNAAVIGIVSGSWTPEFAMRFPFGAQVIIRTHHDLAGDKYAATIAQSLARRCFVSRSEGV